MCGISGISYFDGTRADPSVLNAMASTMTHRGPDDSGIWCSGPVGFGHRRLSIIDVAGSRQPMASAEGRHHLCFNGEILNYRQLRAELDYPFATGGDTEVLLASLLTHGSDAVQRLDGQFAFALHDEQDGSLLLARDRLGILPLYYYRDAHMFAFASELKALLPALGRRPDVDRAALTSFLATGSTPAPVTLLAGVRKLMPGHLLHVARDGSVRETRYWAPPGVGEELAVTDREAVDLLDAALQASVQAALVADVPVGAYLSGGLDSSLIVAMMSRVHTGAVQTFSAGFTGSDDDELPYAREVSALLGTVHHEVTVGPADFQELWHRLTWHRDAPVSQPADVAVFRLAELARRDVKVVLSGEGSDELFAGYPKYAAAAWVERGAKLPLAVRRALSQRAEGLLPERAARLRAPLRALAADSEGERFRTWFAPFSAAERRSLLGEHEELPYPPWAEAEGDLVRRMLHVDCHGWLSDNLLERGDRMSMAASLELRPPFLGKDVVDLAFRLPSRVKLRGRDGKWVVKQVGKRYLPAGIVNRRKVGFRVPLERWFRGELQQMARDMLCGPSSFVGGTLDRRFVTDLLERHASGRSNEASRIWTLLCLEVWHDTLTDMSAGIRQESA
jgi:asparagine synthase (glutamine-hydrolysing)